jgi:hypothetical protein
MSKSKRLNTVDSVPQGPHGPYPPVGRVASPTAV